MGLEPLLVAIHQLVPPRNCCPHCCCSQRCSQATWPLAFQQRAGALRLQRRAVAVGAYWLHSCSPLLLLLAAPLVGTATGALRLTPSPWLRSSLRPRGTHCLAATLPLRQATRKADCLLRLSLTPWRRPLLAPVRVQGTERAAWGGPGGTGPTRKRWTCTGWVAGWLDGRSVHKNDRCFALSVLCWWPSTGGEHVLACVHARYACVA